MKEKIGKNASQVVVGRSQSGWEGEGKRVRKVEVSTACWLLLGVPAMSPTPPPFPHPPIKWVAAAAVQRSHDDVDVAAVVVVVVVALLCPCVSVSAAHIVGRR